MPFNLSRSREIARTTCLRAFAGRDSIKSVVFDATTLSADSFGRYTLPIGTFLTRQPADPTKVKAYAAAGSNVSAQQTITITGTPTGGSFTATYGGVTSGPIAYNASAANVVTALTAMSSIGAGNVTASGGALPGTPVVVTFAGALANQPITLMTSSGAGLTGGSAPAVAITTTTTGQTAEAIIGVFDGPDKDFFGNTSNCDEPIPMYFHACDFDISKLQNWAAYGTAAKAALPNCDFS